MVMEEIRTDEGHIFSEEDYIFNIKWKVNLLINQKITQKMSYLIGKIMKFGFIMLKPLLILLKIQ